MRVYVFAKFACMLYIVCVALCLFSILIDATIHKIGLRWITLNNAYWPIGLSDCQNELLLSSSGTSSSVHFDSPLARVSPMHC